ncbi:MAG: hypothetical protein PHF84_05295, partial [bacterium]|nr:hypothetical protein [bacterium]
MDLERPITVKTTLYLFLLFLCCTSLLTAGEFHIDFQSPPGIQFNPTNMEIDNGRLRLSPTGWFWTNTDVTSFYYSLTTLFYETSPGIFIYGCQEMGPSGEGYLSTNYGKTWASIVSPDPQSIIRGSDNYLYLTAGSCCGDSVVRSYDNGRTWNNINPGSANGAKFIFEDSHHDFYLAKYKFSFMSYTSNIIYKSRDYGTTWGVAYREGTPTPLILNSLDHIMELKTGALLLNALQYCFISSNHGTNWTKLADYSNSANQAFRLQDGQVYLYGQHGIHRLDEYSLGLVQISTDFCRKLMETDDSVLYRSGLTNHPYRSYDKGYTWQPLPAMTVNNRKVENGYMMGIQASDRKIYYGAMTNDNYGGFIFRSGYIDSARAFLTIHPNDYIMKWDDYSAEVSLNGGSVQYEFAASRDGGKSFDSWLTLSRENLRNVPCATNGQDLLNIRITLFSPGHETTPEISRLVIQYQTLPHFNDLSSVKAAPNPFKRSGRKDICFFNLTDDFKIRIFSAGGGEIMEMKGR